MTTQLGTDLLAAALSIISDVGQAVTFKVPGTETYNPDTGEYTEGTVSDVAATISPFLQHVEQYQEFLGPLFRDVDAVCYIAASGLSFTPDLGTRIVDGVGNAWRIIRVVPLSGDERVAAYEMFVGR